MAETLWQEFANETEEHLDLIEPLLAAGGKALGAEDIAQLFRSFHSVKGVTRAMDIVGMEQVAHGAENILGLVREGLAQLDDGIIDVLLVAVDTLKRLRQEVTASRTNVPPPASVTETLDRVFILLREAAGQGDGGGAAEVSASPDSPPASSGGSGIAAAELHEDEELLNIYVEVLEQRLPDIAPIVSAQANDPAVRAEVLDALTTLSHGADMMGFEALAETLRGLEAMVPPDRQIDEGMQRELLPLIGQLRTQAELLGEVVGATGAAKVFGAALTGALGPSLASVIQDLSNAVSHAELGLIEEGLPPSEADTAEVAALARLGGIALGCLGHDRASDLLALVDDLFARAAQGAVVPTGEMLAQTRAILDGVDPRLPFQPGLYRDSDITSGDYTALSEAFRSALTEGAARTGAAEGQFIGGVYIRGELFEALTADQVPQVEEMLAGGHHPFALLLHLEADTDIAGAIVQWLTVQARAITNRTVLRGHESWFEFLVLSKHPPAEVSEALGQIDPRQRCLRQLRLLTAAPSGEILLGTESEEAEAPAVVSAPTGEAAGDRPAAVQPQRGQAGMVLRVRSESIDRFMGQIGELRVIATGLALLADDPGMVLAMNSLRRLSEGLPPAQQADMQTALATVQAHHRRVRDLDQNLDSALVQLHAAALDLRVVPLDTVFNRFPRIVRDLAHGQGKDVALVLEGREVRIDKSMVDLLIDPLMHMVRNAIDHGIEGPADRERAGKPGQATLTLRAVQRSAEAVIEIVDDGRGIDPERVRQKAVSRGLISDAESRRLTDDEIIRYIFRPGFSTVEVVTEMSGRGVGMDVVLTSVTRMGGSIDIRTRLGRGTTFVLQLPLTAALQNTLLVECGGQILGLPERNVTAVEEVHAEDIQLVGGQRAILHRGIFLPIYHLGALLGLERAPVARPQFAVAVVAIGHVAIGVEVDRLHRRQELFLKDLHPEIARFPAIGGASILGDGRVVLILDAEGLIQMAKRSGRGAATPVAAADGGAG